MQVDLHINESFTLLNAFAKTIDSNQPVQSALADLGPKCFGDHTTS